ncbi:MAG TPA: hypothetical protein VK074_02620 [Fodinibius sp.]|nr:hypothetical protein [Fodinibius sp.]
MITGVKATVTVSRKSSSTPKSSFSLSYAVSSGYKSFSPGRYDITYVVDGKTILNHTFAIGNNSYQSLLVAGMMPGTMQTNPQTTLFTIRNLLAGSENNDINGYMPQYLMLRDQFRGSKEKGLIRLINLSPFARSVAIHEGQQKILQADYLHKTAPMGANPGTHHLQFFMNKILLAEKSLSVRKGYLHTVITGNGNSGHSLTSVSYDSPAQAVSQ